MRRVPTILAASAVALGAAGPASAHPMRAAAPRTDIVATAQAAGQFHTLTALLKRAGLAKTLQGKGPYTVFAPTDSAFA